MPTSALVVTPGKDTKETFYVAVRHEASKIRLAKCKVHAVIMVTHVAGTAVQQQLILNSREAWRWHVIHDIEFFAIMCLQCISKSRLGVYC